MARISQSVTIAAEPEAVFDLIARVEEFPLYADALKKVEKIGPRRYRWVARVHGFMLSWDSRITEFRRPVRLAWRSIRGFKNSGTYQLTKIPGGTKIELSIAYRFEAGRLGKLMELLVAPVTRVAAAAILQRVKNRLERQPPDPPLRGLGDERRVGASKARATRAHTLRTCAGFPSAHSSAARSQWPRSAAAS